MQSLYKTRPSALFQRLIALRAFSCPSNGSCASTTPVVIPVSQSSSGNKNFTPKEMVAFLDQHIIGQTDAKRAVAMAVRQRWRRKQIADKELREDVMPKNILLVGPTGVGKTEIARKLAKLVDAPFIKVEATKFTEVGYQGRDVDQIIRDLVEISIHLQTQKLEAKLRDQMIEEVNEIILTQLIPSGADRAAWRELLLKGELDDQEVTLNDLPPPSVLPSSPAPTPNTEHPEMETASTGAVKTKTFVMRVKGPNVSLGTSERVKVKDARQRILNAELQKKVTAEQVYADAIRSVEEDGIVVIDEIDKIVTKAGRSSGTSDASDEGVQRDLLPIVEGTTISTKHGNVKTDHILFIGSGAFAAVKPSDMISELQGRFPVRVALNALSEEDLYRILTEPKHNLIKQQKALFETEGAELEISDEIIKRVANVSNKANSFTINIGARRLGGVMEKLVEGYSFDVAETVEQWKKEAKEGKPKIVVSVEEVEKVEKDLLKKHDLRRFVL